jgi:hypothetical protein
MTNKTFEQQLFELVYKTGEVCGLSFHIIDTTDYSIDGVMEFRIYHKNGYCFDVREEIERDNKGNIINKDYTFFAEWEGFDNSITPEKAIELLK